MHNLELIIKVKPRIHITLIGMDRNGFRINGGAGFAIQEPMLELRFTRSETFYCADHRGKPFLVDEIERLHSVIDKAKAYFNFFHNIRVEIAGNLPTHFGLGSSTATRLACIEALHTMNSSRSEMEQIILLSGRGGTSGIGINTYFQGGFVIDLGVKKDRAIHRPSSISEDRLHLPLLMQRLEMPEWEIGICIPDKIEHKTEKEEKEFFKRTCPIASEKVHEILYKVMFGVYASVRENDKQTFIRAIKQIQQTAWKLAERSEYGNRLRLIENMLYSSGALSVGMSSLGPSLFFIADNISEVAKKMKKQNFEGELIITKATNEGRAIARV